MRWLKISLISILLILFLLFFGIRFYFSSSTAHYHGEIQSSKISAAVDVTFDQKGIPQIWAKTDLDMYYALGYLHASERLFQMELIRHVSYGRLSELFGEITLDFDKMQRRIGFAHKAKNEVKDLDKSTRKILESYSAGVNDWIQSTSTLPPEFLLLQHDPKEWTVENSLAVTIYQTWFSHALMDRDTVYSRLMELLGDSIETQLSNIEQWSPRSVPSSFVEELFSGESFPLRGTKASNSWVISGEKSESGAVIHNSDPHLLVNRVPNFWYIAGLHSEEGSNFVGITFPGLPVAVMGHNDSISYAFTVASIDLNDYYKAPKNGNQVELFGEAEDISEREEIFYIAAGKSQKETLRSTSLGPILSESDSTIQILHWAGYDFNYAQVARNMLQLIKQENFSSFRKIVSSAGALDANWTYSDRKGNIAYQLGAPIPRRFSENTFKEQDASNPMHQWKGYYSLDSIPYVLNPKQNFVASHNNQLVDENFPIKVPGFYDFYRIVRSQELLEENKKFTLEDMKAMQNDHVSVLAKRWKYLLVRAAKNIGRKDIAKRIESYNGKIDLDRDEHSIFLAWWYYLPKFIFEDELGKNWAYGTHIIEDVLQDKTNSSYDNRVTDRIENQLDILSACLSFVLKEYEGVPYGEIQKLKIKHLLSADDSFRSKALDFLFDFNPASFGFPADNSTLSVSYYFKEKKGLGFSTQVAASMRYILDWANPDEFQILTNLGQSGNPFSPHYDDFLEDWKDGKYWTVPISKERVYSNYQSLLKFVKTE